MTIEQKHSNQGGSQLPAKEKGSKRKEILEIQISLTTF